MEKDALSPESTENRIKRLYDERAAVLSLPPEKALDRILEAEAPAALVHSFSDEDFYLLVQEIGPGDALELVSLASNRQWEFLLDMEVWKKERFDSPAVTRWIDYLMKADARRLARWVLEEKAEFFELYLFRNIEIRIREHDEDPSVFGEDAFTLDDVLYVRFIDYPFDSPLSSEEKKTRQEVLMRFLKNLAEYDYPRYHHFLMESAHVIPAESEEEMYRLRSIRMAEKGFLPYHEAVGIYRALSPDKVKKRPGKFIPKRLSDLLLPVPVGFSRVLGEDTLFARAIREVEAQGALFQIQAEFAALCNRIISADQKTVQDREALREVVKKACGYVSIGMERLAPEHEKPSPAQAAAMLVRYPLEDLFRLGFGAGQALKWRAQKWKKTSWFFNQGLPLAFWGEEELGVLGGLLIPRPLFYDNYETGFLYREFATLEEVRKTERILEGIMALDDLFSHLNIHVTALAGRPFFTYKNCLLTLWAAHHLGLNPKADADALPVTPLAMSDFKGFFSRLWEGKTPPRKIRKAMKADFLAWLCTRSGLSEDHVRRRVGSILENLFNTLESEYCRVALTDLDPRFIHLFLIQKP